MPWTRLDPASVAGALQVEIVPGSTDEPDAAAAQVLANLREQLYVNVHELGHCFNLFHSFHKQFMTPPLPNRPEYLAAWIANPQRIKPGTNMPPTSLPPEDLDALAAYLGSLK